MSVGRDANGFLFGLTLTEIMVLFVFLLALLVGVVAAETDELARALDETKAGLARERGWNDAVSAALDVPGPVRAVPTRLALERRVVELDARLDALVRDREALADELDGVRSLLGADGDTDRRGALAGLVKRLVGERDPSDSPDALEHRLDRVLAAAEASDDEAEACPSALATLQTESADLSAELAQATSRAERCAARVALVVERHAREAGRGANWPPCWVSAKGRSEYLFEITMRPAGYAIRAAWGPERADDAAAVPGALALVGATLAPRRLVGATEPIYAQSVADSCRHFVRVVDELGNDKALYKRRLDRIERHFYKRLL